MNIPLDDYASSASPVSTPAKSSTDNDHKNKHKKYKKKYKKEVKKRKKLSKKIKRLKKGKRPLASEAEQHHSDVEYAAASLLLHYFLTTNGKEFLTAGGSLPKHDFEGSL